MFKGKSVAVVVPAYNEEKQIVRVLKTMPDFVDRIIIVNDGSSDNTETVCREFIAQNDVKRPLPEIDTSTDSRPEFRYAEKVAALINKEELKNFGPAEIFQTSKDSRYVLISLEKNSGVGASIARGYKWCKDHHIDCTAVMAGDGQMDPAELPTIVEPVCIGEVDYVKGNRLFHQGAWVVMPKIRYLGNAILSVLTKIASGYWHVSDTQCGYTAISLEALKAIRLDRIFKKYGMPNDLLVRLNIAFCKVKEVPIKPVYRVGENSKMKIWKVIPAISFLLVYGFIRRLYIKYLFKDFHPLFLFYHFHFILLIISILFLIKGFPAIFTKGPVLSSSYMLLLVFLLLSGLQSLFFAMWMDMQDNERLYKI